MPKRKISDRESLLTHLVGVRLNTALYSKLEKIQQESYSQSIGEVIRNILLNKKKRGVYVLIVEMYSDVITSMAITMALDIIREDLEKESGAKVELNYFSLAQAVAKFKKKAMSKSQTGMGRREFKDANELTDNQSAPGKFKID